VVLFFENLGSEPRLMEVVADRLTVRCTSGLPHHMLVNLHTPELRLRVVLAEDSTRRIALNG
jgi:hypothetical protein